MRIPSDIFAEDFIDTLIRFGLYFGAAMQIIALVACFTTVDEPCERSQQCELTCTDSDDYSSEQSSPGHKPSLFRARRHDKKKRR